MTTGIQSHVNEFTNTLRYWRKTRKMSQLDLALCANVSQRHVSWLETGRSQPSRDMVLKLAEAMKVPLRERNQILKTAGFASIYTENKLDEVAMEPVSKVLDAILKHHEPFPAFVLDRMWNIKMKNQAALSLFQIVAEEGKVWQDIGDDGQHNMALLILHPEGLRKFVSNWKEISLPFMLRLKSEAFESGDSDVIAHYNELLPYLNDSETVNITQALIPVIPIEFDFGKIKLSMYSVISTFGTAQDITANELRIETFYPSNDETAEFFKHHK